MSARSSKRSAPNAGAPASPAAAPASLPAAVAATPVAAARAAPALTRDLAGSLRILTCGSVDDGKSTLIGRLLWDASDLYDDQRETIRKSGKKAGDGINPDFSLLVDGLAAEREQGITIDIAWRYFDTEKRRYVIIDSPGHEQYTRNMASGASHADVAVLLVDARAGLKRQTRRHAAILQLVGVRRVVLAVNKMDLVEWSQDEFRAISSDFHDLAVACGFEQAVAIPVCGPSGDNVAVKSGNMPWYTGPTLLQHLDSLPSRVSDTQGPFRMAVQTVLRDGRDFRGLAGTITSGQVKVGDRIVDHLSGQSARVARIVTMSRDLKAATVGQAVTIQPDRDLDIARGAVLSVPGAEPTSASEIEARLVWLNDAGFDPKAGYLLRTATDLVPITAFEIKGLIELETLETRPGSACAVNDIAVARIKLGRKTALDLFVSARDTGAVMIVDAITGATVAGGAVTQIADAADERIAAETFRLTRAVLASGVCRDLGTSEVDKEEFARRAGEVAILLRQAGVAVALEL